MKLRATRPSPALAISVIALFVALGGSAYAVNQVGTKDIKNNAISAAKIKKNAVTTAKIKNNAVTGAKVNEATLGTVPSATHAATADSATNAANFKNYLSSGLKKAGHGQTVTLLEIGPFNIVGKCIDGGGGSSEAKILMKTSQVGSSMYSYEDSYYEANFNPGVEVELGYDIRTSSPRIGWEDQYSYYTGFWAASADGNTLLNGDAVTAVNMFGSQCAFWVDGSNAAA